MKIERLEKIVPLGLIIVFAILIVIRVSNVLHISLANSYHVNAVHVLAISGLGALAAIFAIVVSISVMAVEHASQEYTHRIMSAFVNSFMFWAMIVAYIGTMVYNLCFVSFIEEHANTMVVDVSTLLQVLCFLLLIPYFIITTSQLHPNYIINKILRTVNAQYISGLKRYYQNERIDVPTDIDRVLPVVEIVEKAIMKGDRDTARTTLGKLYDCYKAYTQRGEPVWVRQYFMDYLLRIGQQGILSQDDNIVARVIEIFGEIGESACCDESIEYAEILATAAMKKDYDVAIMQGIDSILLTLKASLSPDAINKAFNILGEMAAELLNIGKLRIVSYLLQQISTITKLIEDTRNQSIVVKCIELLERIGLTAADRRQNEISRGCILSFHKIGTISVSQGVVAEEGFLNSLLKIERATPTDNREIRSQIDYVIKDIEKCAQKPSPGKAEEVTLDTSDLWEES